MNKFKFCGSDGIIKEIGGLYYGFCTGCTKHIKAENDRYQYMGSTRSNCEYVWNINNPISGKYRSTKIAKKLHRNIG